MAYNIYIKEALSTKFDWHEVTDDIVSTNFKIRSGFSSLGSDADLGKLSLTYKAYDLATATIFSTSPKRVRIIKDGHIIFEGYSDGSSSVDSTEMSGLAYVKITAYPYIKALEDVEMPENVVEYDMMASSVDKDTESVARMLWNYALDNSEPWVKTAIEESYTVTFPDISETIPLVKISKGDKPMELLADMMGEYCYSIYTEGSGTVTFFRPYEADATSPTEIPFESVFTKPSIKTAPYVRKKSPQITLSKIVTHANVLLYSLAGESGENVGYEVYKSAYYPEEADGEISYSSDEYENDMVSFEWAKGLSIQTATTRSDFEGAGTFAWTRLELLGDKAYYRIQNTGNVSFWLNQLKIYADKAYFYDKSTIIRSTGEGDKNEIETEWIQTKEDAVLYAQTLANESRCNTSSITFKSDILESTIEPGILVKVGDIPATYLVKSVEWDLDTNARTYSCVIYDLEDIDTEMLYRSSSSLKGPKGDSAPELFYMWSSSPDSLITPKHAMWRFMATAEDKRYMLLSGSLLGDFSVHDWIKDWSEVIDQRTDEFCYLWAKVGERGQPFLLQGTPGVDGRDALLFSIRTSETTIIKDMRSQQSQTVNFTIEKSGYYGETVVYSSVGTIEDGTVTFDRKRDSITLTAFSIVPAKDTFFSSDLTYFEKQEDGSWEPIQATSSDYQNYHVEEVRDTLTLSAVDMTGNAAYIGAYITTDDLPTSYSDSENLIDGDYAIVDKPDGTTPRITLYEYSMTSGWVEGSSPEKKAATVEIAVARAKEYIGEGIDYVDVLYSHDAYIVNLTAAVISASNIYAADIESFGYSEDSDGAPQSGYKLEYQGGTDGKGIVKTVGMRAKNATFENSTIERDCQVYGTLINQDEDGNIVLKTEQSNLAVSSMSSARTDGVSTPGAFQWSAYYNVIRNRVAGRTANTIYKCTANLNGTSYKGYCNKTSISTPPDSTSDNEHQYTSTTTLDFAFKWTKQETFQYAGTSDGRVTINIKIPEDYPTIKIRSMKISSNQYRTGQGKYTVHNADWYKLTVGSRVYADFAGAVSNDGWIPPSVRQSETFADIIAYPGETIKAEIGGKYDVPTYQYAYMGEFVISLYEEDSWTTGLKLIKSSGTLVEVSSAFPSSGLGTTAQTFTDDGVDYSIIMSASALWPVAKYYSFQWDSAPSNSSNIATSFIGEGSLLSWNGNSLSESQIGSATFSKSGITLVSTTGTSYPFVVGGYYTQYNIVLSTRSSILGIYAKNLMPVETTSNVGGADSEHLWNAVYCNTIYSNNQAAISKRSMKENIKPWKKDALALLEGVEIVGFNYISDREKNYHIGFIADDTDEALAGIQHDRMDTTNCIGVLIKAVQELSERIKLLEEK